VPPETFRCRIQAQTPARPRPARNLEKPGISTLRPIQSAIRKQALKKPKKKVAFAMTEPNNHQRKVKDEAAFG
jgi:hypothetical protein